MFDRETITLMWTGSLAFFCAWTAAGTFAHLHLAVLGIPLSFMAGLALILYAAWTWPYKRSRVYTTALVVGIIALALPVWLITLAFIFQP